MNFSNPYLSHREESLYGRYILPFQIEEALKMYQDVIAYKAVGYSIKNNPIYLVTIGNGANKVLAWSQMHGNESTTTKALIDFLSFIYLNKTSKTVKQFLKDYTFNFIPQLNPDGAIAYTRENALGVDLNRDFAEQTQPETKILIKVYHEIKPHFCLNMHDQRSIYGFSNNKPCAISFLAPSANKQKTITSARKAAIDKIEKMCAAIIEDVPLNIGRYDDTFNINCAGDTFQSLATPTILFEAGHINNDYEREFSRFLIYKAIGAFFNLLEANNEIVVNYHLLPQNIQNFRDVILRNINLNNRFVDVVIQYQEVLKNDQIYFNPIVEDIVTKSTLNAHKEVNFNNEALLNNINENIFVGNNLSTKIIESLNNRIIF